MPDTVPTNNEEAIDVAWKAYLSDHGYATVPTSPDTGADFSAGFEAGAQWQASQPREVRTVEARGVIYAQEELVRKDAFTERTIRILDDLENRVQAGEFVSDIFTPSTPNQQGAEL